MGMRTMAVGLLACAAWGCADPCAKVECRRPREQACVSSSTLEVNSSTGTCDPRTAACEWAQPRLVECGDGNRCTEGACACDPTTCPGCCTEQGCVAVNTDARCGVGGVTCSSCGEVAICSQGACQPCPAGFVSRGGQCLRDALEYTVEGHPWLTPVQDGPLRLTLWDWSSQLVTDATLVVPEVSPDGGAARLAVHVDHLGAWGEVQVPVTMPSGTVHSIHVRAIHSKPMGPSRADYIDDCRLDSARNLLCGGQLALDASVPLVGVDRYCVLDAEHHVLCEDAGVYEPRFPAIGPVAQLSWPCLLTLDGRIFCEPETSGAPPWEAQGASWRQVECRGEACCALSSDLRAWCWGYHEWSLFSPVDVEELGWWAPDPVRIPRLPSRYVRLSSSDKSFLGRDLSGTWWSAVNRLFYPSTSNPFPLDWLGTDQRTHASSAATMHLVIDSERRLSVYDTDRRLTTFSTPRFLEVTYEPELELRRAADGGAGWWRVGLGFTESLEVVAITKQPTLEPLP